jgi:hypothetical protein
LPEKFTTFRSLHKLNDSEMATKGLKAIAPVPTSTDFLDIVLSKTQRKTPTVSECISIGDVALILAGDTQKLQN